MAPAKNNGQFKLDSLKEVETTEEAGTWVDVKHPNGGTLYLGKQKKTPLRIKVAGRYSKKYRQAQKAANKAIGFKGDDDDARGVEVLSRITMEWDGAFDDEGTPIPLTKENAAVLYRAAFFIAEQVDLATLEHERFFSVGSTS